MAIQDKKFLNTVFAAFFTLAFVLLYFVQLDNYLLFHTIVEIFSVVIAFSVYIIVWNGKSYIRNNYLLLLGIAYLFIGFLDLLHTFGYKGMSIFRGYDFYANQLWIAARGLEAGSMFAGVFLIRRKKMVSIGLLFVIYTAITVFFIYSIFFSDIFPVCFIEGVGQTPFKIGSEILINIVLIAALVLVVSNRGRFTHDTFRCIVLSIIFTIIAELAFTVYIDNYGLSNMIGHYCKIISFYFIYRGLVRINIIEPYDTIFSELTIQKEELRKADEMKTRLFRIISHDLRSPLAGVAGMADALYTAYGRLPDQKILQHIVDLRESANNTAAMVENLMDWAQLEADGVQVEKIRHNLAEVVEESVSPLESSFRLKNVKLDIQSDAEVMISTDKPKLLIILRNILSNALKYSAKGTSVELSAGIRDGVPVVVITDHGTGMDFSPELLVNPVNESKIGTDSEKGSGLGLYMINKYTEEIGGRVAFESSPGQGTRVTVTLPGSAE